MCDKPKSDATAAKKAQPIRPSTVSIPTSSRTKITSKEKVPFNGGIKQNQDGHNLDLEQGFPVFDDKCREMAYNRFMGDVLNECIIDDKIEREETPIELLMTQLSDRFRKTLDQLDKTSERLKNICFGVEEKRLLELKSNDSSQFYETANEIQTGVFIEEISATDQAFMDKVNLNKVDFTFNKNSGHRQLLDTVNDAIEGLEKIKRESNLDIHKLQDIEFSKDDLDTDKSKFDVESIKSEFQIMFPKISDKLLKEASEKIAKMIDNDFDVVSDDDDDDIDH